MIPDTAKSIQVTTWLKKQKRKKKLMKADDLRGRIIHITHAKYLYYWANRNSL